MNKHKLWLFTLDFDIEKAKLFTSIKSQSIKRNEEIKLSKHKDKFREAFQKKKDKLGLLAQPPLTPYQVQFLVAQQLNTYFCVFVCLLACCVSVLGF